jgi:hypothetical protein
LLTDAPAVQIAARLGLAEAAINAYHDCCYDVRDRLDRPDYIIPELILADRPSRSASAGVETAIKVIAYLGGPAALEQSLLAPGARGGSGDLLAASAEAAGSLVDVLQYVVVLRQGDVANAVGRASLLQNIRRRAAEQPAQLNAYEKNVDAFLKRVTFRCGPPEPEDYPPIVRQFMNAAVELRADQMDILMQGGELPNAAELLAKTLPLPRRPEDAGQGADAGA